MKEQDLLESFSGISEDLLKRSEDNKKLGSNEKTAAGKGNGKAGNAWRRLGYIAAILLLTAGITILFINIKNKNENGVTDITGENTVNNEKEKVAEEVSVPDFLKTYTVSAAEYPTTLKKPDYNEFDLNGDKVWDGDENQAYLEAAQEWAKQVAEQKNIEGYDKDAGKSSILSFDASQSYGTVCESSPAPAKTTCSSETVFLSRSTTPTLSASARKLSYFSRWSRFNHIS